MRAVTVPFERKKDKIMGLSEPVDRSLSHIRRIKCEGYARADGMLDIEGELRDTKSYDFPSSTHGTLKAGEHIHQMQVRITIDFSLTIRDAEAVTLSGPYQICPKGAENIKGLIGLTIGPGWKRKVQQAIGGPKGCTHITELMGPMATTAFQTLYGEKAKANRESGEDTSLGQSNISTPLPSLTNSCIAYAEEEPAQQ